MRLRTIVPAGLLMALSLSSVAEANWPVARHDPHRTGAASGASDLTAPVPYYRTYLGGYLAQGQLLVADVTGDGQTEILYVTGGRVVAKDARDNTLWQTPPLGLGSLDALEDLDGDGSPELMTTRQDGVVVLAAKTGDVLWAQPAGQIGTLGGARLADLDGDGKKDVVTEECGCCGVNSGNPGYIYSFASGASQPTLVSKLPFAACGGGSSLSVFDAAPGGSPRLIVAQNDRLSVVDPLSGAAIASTGALGPYTSASLCRAANLDATPGDELVCVLNDNVANSPDQRRAYALRYSPTPTPTLSVIWSKTLAPFSGGDLSVPEFLVDLDGDGQLEVLLASYDGSSWTTRILDAATGNELASLPGETVNDWAPVGPGKSIVFFTGALKAWTFQRQATPAVAAAWTLPGVKTVSALDLAQAKRVGRPLRSLTIDQEGETLLVVTSTKSPYEVTTVRATSGQAKTVATYTLPDDVTPLTLWSVAPTTTTYPQLAMASNDGYLKLFDKALFPVNVDDKSDLQGVRIGGYYASGSWREFARTPRTMSLDGGKAESIIVADSRGALLRYNAAGASLGVPPVRAWQRPSTTTPSIVAGLDGGKPGIACVSEGQATVLRADGTPVWQKSVGPILGDLVPATLGADATPDLVTQWGPGNDVVLHTVGLDGATGSALWSETPYLPGAGRQPAGIAVADWNGDGVDDVLQQGGSLRVTSGKDGAPITSGGPGDAYFMPIVYDVDGDSAFEVTLHAGFSPARTLRKDFSPVWTGSEDDRPYPYGAIASCASGPVLVEGSWQFPARLKLSPLAGAGSAKTTVLASGQAYADQAAAIAAGARPGQLTAANVHTNLTGDQRPIAVLGSADGYLYGVDPCDEGKIVFAVNFGAAVGEPVFGDSDGDGLDELIVSVADGYLYGLRNFALPAVTEVRDIDVCLGGTTEQNTGTSTDALRASWTAVSGAASYQVSAVGPGGLLVAPWADVGDATEATINDLTLKVGSLYRFVVRAVNASGKPSVDTLSDGLIVFSSSSNGCPGQTGAGGASGGAGAAGQGAGGGLSGSSGQGGATAGVGGAGAAGVSGAGGNATGGAGAGGGGGSGGAGAGGGAGAAGSSGVSGSSGQSGGGGLAGTSGAGAAGSSTDGGDDGGCGCTTAGSAPARGAWAGLLALAGAVARRRRR